MKFDVFSIWCRVVPHILREPHTSLIPNYIYLFLFFIEPVPIIEILNSFEILDIEYFEIEVTGTMLRIN